ncbi:MAG: segregation/condensation protein A [Clostridia bacterium]|nr:segregation/condensation protein A [Clostridia bacterium]
MTSSQYKIKMDNFEGPLDLLCHLVEKNKMNIFDIKINEITNQYIEYLQTMQEMNLEVTSEFIIMASRLIYLKSKILLPSLEKNEDEEEIDLTQMLIEYKKYKESAGLLKSNLHFYGGKFYKLPEKIDLPKGKIERLYEADVMPDIYANFLRKEIEKKNINADNVNKLAIEEKVTIRSKIKEILKQLWKKPSFIFNKVFNKKTNSRVEIVTAFLSLLELSKMSRIKISQNALFGDINVMKVKKEKI